MTKYKIDRDNRWKIIGSKIIRILHTKIVTEIKDEENCFNTQTRDRKKNRNRQLNLFFFSFQHIIAYI